MKYFKNKVGNLELHFRSPISRDNGTANEFLGNFNCTMELFTSDTGAPEMIEWIVEDDEGNVTEVEHIGLWFAGKSLTDYDGVFELPKQAISLIRKIGYTVSKDFE